MIIKKHVMQRFYKPRKKRMEFFMLEFLQNNYVVFCRL